MRKLQIICGILFLVALGFLIYNFLVESHIEDAPYYAIREPRPEPEPVPEPEPTPEPLPEPEPEPEPIPRVLLTSIVALREYYDNPDIVGRISIPNTNIHYPIAQTGNNVFYLYHDLRFNRTSAGSIFLDYWNDFYELSCDNFLIYGHNMRAGNKFHNVRYFNREDYFRARPFIYITTPYRYTQWEIFSFFHTTTAFCYLTTVFHDRDAFYEFILYLQESSHHTTDVVLSPDDQIVILSTCGVEGGENRYILIARLIRDGEDDQGNV